MAGTDLTGRHAVVTGGGRGIGRGITEALRAAGAEVLIAQREAPAELLAADSSLRFCAADLAHVQAPAAIAAACRAEFPRVDILVNNAGLMFEAAPDALEPADWDRMMAVNLRAPAFLTAELLPLMSNGGSVVNVGSIEGLAANPLHTAYCASKGGLHALTRAQAVDLGEHGVRCNAIAPGWIDSDLSRAYIDAQPAADELRVALRKLHPAGRTGTPDDVGQLVAWLAADAAAFVTGQVIVIDGGRTAKLPLPW